MGNYDIIILGGGPAGYVAAIHGAQKGARIALIEAYKLGGTCLNRGCIPTKILVEAMHLWQNSARAEKFGLQIENKKLDLGKLTEYKDKVINMLESGIKQLLKKNKIDIFPCRGEITDLTNPIELTLEDGRKIKGGKLLIATGSKVSLPPILGLADSNPLTSDVLLDLQQLPKELIIIGGGVVGLEMASVYNGFGTNITLLEMMEEILSGLDKEMCRRLEFYLKRRGIKIITGAAVNEINGKSGRQVTVHYKKNGKEDKVTGEYILLATGRRANLNGCSLLGAEDYLKVDEYLATDWPNVYAAGDITGGSFQLAHVASREGILAIDNMLGEKNKIKYAAVPNCIFTDPPLASVGLSSEDVIEKNLDHEVFKFPYSALGIATATGNSDGFVKIIADGKNQYILGMHILGHGATELVHNGVLAIDLRLNLVELSQIIYAHPTYSESMGEIFTMALGKYYHTLRR